MFVSKCEKPLLYYHKQHCFCLFFQSQFVEVLAVSVSGMVNPLTAQGDFSWQDSLLSAVNSKSQNLVDPS